MSDQGESAGHGRIRPAAELVDEILHMLPRMQAREQRLARLSLIVREPEEFRERLDALRAIWREVGDDVIESLVIGASVDPYYIDWLPIFTPIEQDSWCYIRPRGLPLLPQVPVGPYVVDFGDPVRRIALECDGARWHRRDRDAERDQRLAKLGWIVLRLAGSELAARETDLWEIEQELQAHHPDEIREAIDRWVLNTTGGFFHAFQAALYGGTLRCSVAAAARTLTDHCLTPTELLMRMRFAE